MSTSMAVCVAALGGLTPDRDVACDRVDLIEVNHFYDEKGRLVFDQIIFYDWCAEQSRYQVRDWRLLKSKDQIPHRMHRGRVFMAVWQDGDVLRRVSASSMRESWTQYDPELLERQFLPRDQRRKLLKTIGIPVSTSRSARQISNSTTRQSAATGGR